MRKGGFLWRVTLLSLVAICLGTQMVLSQNNQPFIDPIANENINEDDPLQSIGLTGIDDGDGGTQVITVTATSSNPALIQNSDINIIYTSPNPTGTLQYTALTDAFGSATITVTVMDDGGTGGGGIDTYQTTFTVNVNFINDPPTFTKGPDIPVAPVILYEDAGPQNFTSWATSINAGGTLGNEGFQILTFNVSVIGTVGNLAFDNLSINSAGTLTFTTTANTNGTATIQVELQDDGSGTPPNSNLSAPQTFTIAVTAVNDAPTFTLGGNITVNEDAGPQLFTGHVSNASPGGGTDETTQNLTFNFNQVGSTGTISFLTPPAIDDVTGNLTFETNPDVNGTAIFELTLQDDGPSTPPDVNTSSIQSFQIVVVPINDPPTFTLTPTFDTFEDAGVVSQTNIASNINAGPIDEDGQTLSFAVTVLSTTGPLTFAVAPTMNSIGTLTFTASPDANGSADLQITVVDNGQSAAPHNNTATQTMTVNIAAVNDPPVFITGIDPTIDEDSGPFFQIGWAQNVAPGPPDEAGQNITFQFTQIGGQGTIGFSSGPAISTAGDLSFQTIAETNGTITFSLVLVDDGPVGGLDQNTSALAGITITVTAVNDPPTFQVGADLVVGENSGLLTFNAWVTGIGPGGGTDEAGQNILFTVTPLSFSGNLFLAIGPLIGDTGDITFQTSPNTFGEGEFLVYLTDDGPSDSPNNNTSNSQSFKIIVNEVNDPPFDISLSSTSFFETAPIGSEIGVFTALDPDDNTHTFALVQGTGSDDNASFSIQGDRLLTNAEFDVDVKNLYTIRVSASDPELLSTEAIFLIDVLREPISTVDFPSAFTPNGDGENDIWLITDIEYFPQASINIYNRTGQTVFKSIGYISPFDGTFRGDFLPEDTYYVVIDLKNDTPVIHGTITILR